MQFSQSLFLLFDFPLNYKETIVGIKIIYDLNLTTTVCFYANPVSIVSIHVPICRTIKRQRIFQVYRIAIVFSPYIRAFVLRMRYRRIKRECIEMVIGKSYVGDWFLIYLMGQVS